MKVLVFFSGGKDSQACLLWALNEYGVNNIEAVFCDTGWENPVTYEHIVNTCKKWNVKLVILRSKKYDGMIDLAEKKKRFPSTKARFCTEELKSKPAIDYVLEHKENVIVIEGIRRNESNSRSKMQAECTYFKYYFEPIGKDKKGKDKYHTYRKKDVVKWCKDWNADKIRPIFNWDANQTINYIKAAGDVPNPLYYIGFNRVGCFPCIMSRQGGIKLIIENHSEQWQALKDAELKVGKSFFPPKYIPHRFTTGRTESGKRFATAEDVERYIKAKNNTIDMFDQDTPSCMSSYNLCE